MRFILDEGGHLKQRGTVAMIALDPKLALLHMFWALSSWQLYQIAVIAFLITCNRWAWLELFL
jgi:hypothetical protein